MAGRRHKIDPLLQAFGSSARNLDRGDRKRRSDVLTRATVLAMLRCAVLSGLSRDGVLAGSPEELWSQAQGLACPILDLGLDSARSDPRSDYLGAVLPDETVPLGELYQHLLEYKLSRSGKNKALRAHVAKTDRKRSGSFFTPDWMAERLVGMALKPLVSQGKKDPVRSLLDPACGNGRLLVAALELWLTAAGLAEGSLKERGRLVRRWILNCVRGVDRDALACALARTALWRLADPSLGPVTGLAEAITVGDAIVGPLSHRGRASGGAVRWDLVLPPEGSSEQGRGFDLILANPPFEVLSGFKRRGGLKAYVERIRKSGYSLATSGNLNTYRLFLERALELLADEGRLAFVLPFGFLMDRTAAPLRSHLLQSGYVEQVEVYPESSQVFEQVGQSVVLWGMCKKSGWSESVQVRQGPSGEVHRVALDQLKLLDRESLVMPVAAGGAIALAARMSAVNDGCLGDLADGRVGEVDQTVYKKFMRSEPDGALLVRGSHLSAYRVDLEAEESHQRWLEPDGFARARGGGRWQRDLDHPRIVQTGIVNMEAARRLVAAQVPPGVFLGNSVNYWVPREDSELDREVQNGYLLGLLNSTPAEWRFRLTSSNNNINLYEIRPLPLPRLGSLFPAERIDAFVERAAGQMDCVRISPLGLVRQITAGWGAPSREDRAVAHLIARVARLRAEATATHQVAWLEHVLDHLVNWHLGLDELDLERMLADVPARAYDAQVCGRSPS